MSLRLLPFVLTVLTCPLHAGEIQLVDLGFGNAVAYLGLDVASCADGKEAIAFSLVSRVTRRAVRLNHCRYMRHRLELETGQIKDAKVRADLSWLFMQSGESSLSLEAFYPELRALLERTRPECPVPPLTRALQAVR